MVPFLEAGQVYTNDKDEAVSPNGDAGEPNPGGDSGEAVPSIGLKRPELPSWEELRDHEKLHIPFRDWCKHCVMGRARNDPHFKDRSQASEVPRISWDYMYMHEEGAHKRRPDIVKGEGLPILVFKDNISKATTARVAPSKGDCEYTIKRATHDMTHLLGYKKMIFKGGQEPALQSMMDTVGRHVGDQIVSEQSPVGESQSNGDIESAVLEIQGLYRTFRSNLESDYEHKILEDHPFLVWLVSHVSMVGFRHKVGSDGRTPYRRLKGKDFSRKQAKFGKGCFTGKPG